MAAVAAGQLGNIVPSWRTEAALTVVMAANGYPGSYAKGAPVAGIERAEKFAGVKVFHAGTWMETGRLVADGGRVLNVTARGQTVADARRRAYDAVASLDFPGGFCRRDIGWRAVERGE